MYASVDTLHFVPSNVHKCDVDIEPNICENFFFFSSFVLSPIRSSFTPFPTSPPAPSTLCGMPMFFHLDSPSRFVSTKVCAALVTCTLWPRGPWRNLGSTIVGQRYCGLTTWPMARGFAPAKAWPSLTMARPCLGRSLSMACWPTRPNGGYDPILLPR